MPQGRTQRSGASCCTDGRPVSASGMGLAVTGLQHTQRSARQHCACAGASGARLLVLTDRQRPARSMREGTAASTLPAGQMP